MVLFDESKKTVEDVIQNCTQLLVEHDDAMVAGAGNKIRNPLLSVFLGKDSIDHIPEIQSTYFSCWSAEARKLKILQGTYTKEEIGAKIAEACRVNGAYATRNEIKIVWYWNIMDDDFEKQFECVKQSVTGPLGTQLKKYYFIFCGQQHSVSMAKTEDRLKRVIAWNEGSENPMLILSDATQQGVLDAKGVTENYHMAASIVLMLNSPPVKGEMLGENLDFAMRGRFWTAGYCVCSRNFFDIIGASLLKIIEKYQEVSSKHTNNSAVQARICEDGNYITFLDDVFEKTIAHKCPNEQNIAFWADMPYTQDIAALERRLTGEAAPARGIFGRLFRSGSEGDPSNAIGSVRDFWNACVNQYYMEPVKAWLSSPEGKQQVLDYMYGKLTAVLTLNDMKLQLPEEWAKLERDPLYQNLHLECPQPDTNVTLPFYLHSCACVEVKKQIYGTLLIKIGDIMKELNQNAGGFETLLSNVAVSLRSIQMDPYINNVYGHHMQQIIDTNQAVLNQKLHPCATETELLGQLENAFVELSNRDKDRVYYYTLEQDMHFLMTAGAMAANNVIDNCFEFDITRAGRLVTMTMTDESGHLYCIMNNQLGGLIGRRNIGTEFIVNRCDRIERLYLYPIQPGTIQYS